MFHRPREDSNRTHATEHMDTVMVGHDMICNSEWDKPAEVVGLPMFDLSKNQDAHTHQRGILAERGKRYGRFESNARIAQGIMDTLVFGDNWREVAVDQREALHQIAAKISRIVTGDPDYVDNWDDIAGFATLVADRLRGISGEGVSHGPDGHSTAVRRDDQLHNIQQGNASTHFSGCSD